MPESSLSIDIRQPLLLKANDLVLLVRRDGDIPADIPGFGLFFRDTCYLGAYRLRLHDVAPMPLMASDTPGIAARIDLANPRLDTANGRPIGDHTLLLRRDLSLAEDGGTFVDAISIRSACDQPITLPVSIAFAAAFEDMFALRGAPPGRRGTLHAPSWDGAALCFAYDGADGVARRLHVTFSQPPIVAPRTCECTTAHFQLAIAPSATHELVVACRVEACKVGEPSPPAPPPPDPAAARAAARAASARLPEGYARAEAPGRELGGILARSLADLALLEVRRGEHRFTAAGMPWFVGLFGRDSLLPTLQCLLFNPDLGAHTTRALAHWQGTKDDERTREQPGKILHELRVGEMANLREVSQTPSYASVDATPLFLIAIVRHAEATGDLAHARELLPAIDRALGWLERASEKEAGYLTYDGLAENRQPVNQSWRDSGTGVLRRDGAYPVPPLALVEVQGYAWQARMLVASLFRRLGRETRAEALESAADRLRARFLHDFWMEAEGCYCLAIEADGRQVASVTSNAAQVLWTGIATPEHARRIAERMMRPDMFSGWGVRTLSAEHAAFDPLAYQQGSVWPFDNALIVSGLRRYGKDAAALRIAEATLDAARGFPDRRLPEFIAGTQRLFGDLPTRTPRADPLQAWSAAAAPFMVAELLGLRVDGFARRVTVERPLLPEGVDRLDLHRIRVGADAVSLRFARRGDGVETVVLEGAGAVEVQVC